MDIQPSRPSAPARRPVGTRSKLIGGALAVLLLLAIVALAWWLIQRNAQTAGAGAMAAGGRGMRGMTSTVGVAQVEAIDIPVTLEALGTVTPLATVTVRPLVSGTIVAIHFKEGQTVKKGDLLAQIDPRPFRNALLEAQGNLQRDEAQLANARLQLERYRTLQTQDSIARQEVDTQAATVKQLEGTVAADRAAVGSAQLDVEYARITAPVAGRIGLRLADVGNYIAAGDSTGIAVITQVEPIDVKFAVPQDSVAEIQQHAAAAPLPATALDRTRTRTLGSGQFLTLDNQVDTSTGTVGGKARFANADGALFPNQFVNLRLQLYVIGKTPAVPLAAVRNGTQGDFVYVLNDDKTVSVRSVTRGAQTADKVQIVKGLQLGETVVTEGADRLKDGASVQLPAEAAAATAAAKKADLEAHPERAQRKRRGPGPGPWQGGPPPDGAPAGNRSSGRHQGSWQGPRRRPAQDGATGATPADGAPNATPAAGAPTADGTQAPQHRGRRQDGGGAPPSAADAPAAPAGAP